jgi:hypothetical protein
VPTSPTTAGGVRASLCAWLGAGHFSVRHVVPVMRTVYRQLTVVLLLSSYLLAAAGTWLHGGHEYSGLHETDGVLVTDCRSFHSHWDEPLSGDVHRACANHPFGWRDGDSHPEHRHQSDQCIVCRFLVIKKSVVFSPDLTTVTECLPQQVTVMLPALRVAELLATPDCRAPPHMA